jgi:outer membrane protein TolC
MIRNTFIAVLLVLVGAAFESDEALPPKVTAQILSDRAAATDQSTLTLDDVVRAALAKNPAVLSAPHTVSAERAKISQAKALQDPKFGVGSMGNAPPFSVQTGDPSSYRSLSAMQTLPPADIANIAPLNYSLDDLYKLARENAPSMKRMQKLVERSQLATNLAHKDYLADLSVGYMYEQRPAMPDMHGFTFTVKYPRFLQSKQREEVRQAKEEELSAASARDNRQKKLYFDLKLNYLAAKASENLLKVFSQGVVHHRSRWSLRFLPMRLAMFQNGSGRPTNVAALI